MWAGAALNLKADMTSCSLGQNLWQLLVPKQPGVFVQEPPGETLNTLQLPYPHPTA